MTMTTDETLTPDQQRLRALLDSAHALTVSGIQAMQTAEPLSLHAAWLAIREGRGRLQLVLELDPSRPCFTCQYVGLDAEGRQTTAPLFSFTTPEPASSALN